MEGYGRMSFKLLIFGRVEGVFELLGGLGFVYYKRIFGFWFFKRIDDRFYILESSVVDFLRGRIEVWIYGFLILKFGVFFL